MKRNGTLALVLAGLTLWGCGSMDKSRPKAPAPPEPAFRVAGFMPPRTPLPPVSLAFSSRGMILRFYWRTNPEPDLAGYILYGGLKSFNYTWSTNVGLPPLTNYDYFGTNVTGPWVEIPPLSWRNGTVYFGVTAYNTSGLESDQSNEVTSNIPHMFWFTNHLETATNPLGPWVEIPITRFTNDSTFQRYFRSRVEVFDE